MTTKLHLSLATKQKHLLSFDVYEIKLKFQTHCEINNDHDCYIIGDSQSYLTAGNGVAP